VGHAAALINPGERHAGGRRQHRCAIRQTAGADAGGPEGSAQRAPTALPSVGRWIKLGHANIGSRRAQHVFGPGHHWICVRSHRDARAAG